MGCNSVKLDKYKKNVKFSHAYEAVSLQLQEQFPC